MSWMHILHEVQVTEEIVIPKLAAKFKREAGAYTPARSGIARVATISPSYIRGSNACSAISRWHAAMSSSQPDHKQRHGSLRDAIRQPPRLISGTEPS